MDSSEANVWRRRSPNRSQARSNPLCQYLPGRSLRSVCSSIGDSRARLHTFLHSELLRLGSVTSPADGAMLEATSLSVSAGYLPRARPGALQPIRMVYSQFGSIRRTGSHSILTKPTPAMRPSCCSAVMTARRGHLHAGGGSIRTTTHGRRERRTGDSGAMALFQTEVPRRAPLLIGISTSSSNQASNPLYLLSHHSRTGLASPSALVQTFSRL